MQTYHAQGDAPMPEIPEETPDGFNEKEFAIATDFWHNSVKANTVGPAAITTTAPAPDIIAFMLGQVKAVTVLGWIGNHGIEKKLEGALAAVKQGKTKAARNKLKAFLHDVLEKSGKHEEKEDEGKREREEARAHIKQNAVAILATNAEVAIYSLGGDPKKHENDDD